MILDGRMDGRHKLHSSHTMKLSSQKGNDNWNRKLMKFSLSDASKIFIQNWQNDKSVIVVKLGKNKEKKTA